MLLNFDASKIEVNDSYDVIPDNTIVNAVITSTEWKETKDKTGGYLSVKYEIIDGNHKGRVIFENLNLQNANQKAVEIAQATLAKICNSIGKIQVQNSEELHNIPLILKLGVNPAQNGYEPSNKIKSYSSAGKSATPTAQTDNTPPWAKK
jgi:hypothetical protein